MRSCPSKVLKTLAAHAKTQPTDRLTLQKPWFEMLISLRGSNFVRHPAIICYHTVYRLQLYVVKPTQNPQDRRCFPFTASRAHSDQASHHHPGRTERIPQDHFSKSHGRNELPGGLPSSKIILASNDTKKHSRQAASLTLVARASEQLSKPQAFGNSKSATAIAAQA